MKRCIIQRCNNDEIAEAIWDARVSMHLVSYDVEFKGCKIVADTYWASASAGARVVSALQSVFSEWVNTEYGKSVENLPVLHDCYINGDVDYISKHKIPVLEVYVTYYMEDKSTVDGFIHIFGSRLNGYYKVDKDSVVITLPSGIK